MSDLENTTMAYMGNGKKMSKPKMKPKMKKPKGKAKKCK